MIGFIIITIVKKMKINKKLFWIFVLSSSVYFTQGIEGLPGLALTFYLKEKLHLTPSVIMYLGAITGLAWLIKPLWGYLCDNYLSKKKWIIISLLGSLITCFYLGISPFLALPIIILLASIGSWTTAVRDVAVDGIMCVEGKEANECGRIQSIQWTSITIAGIIAGLIGGYVADHFNYQFGYLCLIPFYLIIMGIVLRYKSKTKQHKEFVKGYVIGLLDGEGHIDKYAIRITNTNKIIIDTCCGYLKELNIESKVEERKLTGNYKQVYDIKIYGKENLLKFYNYFQDFNSRKIEELKIFINSYNSMINHTKIQKELIKLYRSNTYTYRQLAKKFNLSLDMTYRLINDGTVEPSNGTHVHILETICSYKELFTNKKFLIGCLFLFLYNFNPSFGTPLFFIERDSFHWSGTFIGILGAVTSSISIIGSILYWKYGKKIDIKKCLFYSVFLGAFTTLCYLYFTPITAIIYGIVFSLVGMFIFLNVMAWMAESTITGKEATSFALLCSINNLAGTASTITGAWLFPKIGLQPLIIVAAFTSFLCLPLIKKLEIK